MICSQSLSQLFKPVTRFTYYYPIPLTPRNVFCCWNCPRLPLRAPRNGVSCLGVILHTAHSRRLARLRVQAIVGFSKASESDSEESHFQTLWLWVFLGYRYSKGRDQLQVRPVGLIDFGQPNYHNRNSASFLHRANRKRV